MTEILSFLNQNSGALTVIFTAVVTLATAIYAVLTWILVSETRQMRKVQTEPRIQITIDALDIAIHLVRLKIKNIGQGPAIELKLAPRALTQTEATDELIQDFTKSNYFKTGLKYFGPGEERVSHFTEMTKNHNGKIEAVIGFYLTYSSLSGQRYSHEVVIDMTEYKGTYRLGTPHLYSIANSLKKIQEDLQRFGSGWHRLKVDAYDSEDRELERKQNEEMREEFRKKHDT